MTQTNLTGRTARCSYYGCKYVLQVRYQSCECEECKKNADERCHCERPSSEELAFFRHKPDEEFDEFYCGCKSWN